MASYSFPLIDAGIAQFEKSNPAYNNPGAIMDGAFARSQGATGTAPNGLATFDNPTSGWQALDALVGLKASKGLTLDQIVNQWAPPDAPGNSYASTQNELSAIAGVSGLQPNQVPQPTQVTDPAASSSPWWTLGGLIPERINPPGSPGDERATKNQQALKDKLSGIPVVGGLLSGSAALLFGLTIGRAVTLIIGLMIVAAGLWTLKGSVSIGLKKMRVEL